MKAGILIGHLTHKGNEGAIIRTAEAFGLNNVFVIGKRENAYKSSEGAEQHVNFMEFESLPDFISYVRSNNYSIICIENTLNSKEIDEVKKYPVNPIFVTGNEKLGVPKELITAASMIIRIQQGSGYVNCLNTGTACGIVIHDFFKKINNKRLELWTREDNVRK